MKSRKILNGLFIFEIVIGAILVVAGLLSNPMNWATTLLGGSVVAAHAMEFLLLARVKE